MPATEEEALTHVIPQIYTECDIYKMEYIVGQVGVTYPVCFSTQVKLFLLTCNPFNVTPQSDTLDLAVTLIRVTGYDKHQELSLAEANAECKNILLTSEVQLLRD